VAKKPGLLVIAGLTGTGKTALAVQLAQKLNTVVLSADSRQIYRGLNIGTAKPTLQEQDGVPHYLLDLADPQETYTVAQYQQAAQNLISDCHQQGQTPLLVGGTGLYIQAVIQGLQIPPIAPDPLLREQLKEYSTAQLYTQLQQKDITAAQRIHPNDRVRLLRALEILGALGHLPERTYQPPAYPILHIALDCSDLTSYTQRLTQRTQRMIELGWIEEMQQLQQTYGADLPLLQTLGYQELGLYLEGQMDLPSAIQLIVLHTRQYAKRQRTWFRRNPEIQWFDTYQVEANAISAQVLEHARETFDLGEG